MQYNEIGAEVSREIDDLLQQNKQKAEELENHKKEDATGVKGYALQELVNYFASSQVSASQWEILYLGSLGGSEPSTITDALCKGSAPFHLSVEENNEANWKLCHETLKEFPAAKRQKVEELKETITDEEKQLEALQRSIQKHKEELEELESSMRILPALEADCPAMSCLAKEISVVEEELLEAVLSCIEKDPYDFSAESDEKETRAFPPLSLVFNAVGLSSQTISCLSDLDGQEFLDSTPVTLCDDNLITDLIQRKEVAYLHHMLSFKQVPYSRHSCVVCDCNAQELQYLVQEHEKEDPVTSAILSNDSVSITGRQFLLLDRNDICKHFLKDISAKQYRDFKKQTQNYFWLIHKQSLMK